MAHTTTHLRRGFWLWARVLAFLDDVDARRLAVCALEAGDAGLLGPLPTLGPAALVPVALVHGCWSALLWLLDVCRHRGRGGRPRWTPIVDAHPQRIRLALLGSQAPHLHRPPRALLTLLWRLRFAPRLVPLPTPPAHALYAAARHGHLEAVAWLHGLIAYDVPVALEAAAHGGHVRLVTWLLRRRRWARAIDPGAAGVCVRVRPTMLPGRNPWGFVAWVVTRQTPRRAAIVRTAHALSPTHGRLPPQALEAQSDSTESWQYPFLDWAAATGDLELVRALAAAPATATAHTDALLAAAAGSGSIPLVQWLDEHELLPRVPPLAPELSAAVPWLRATQLAGRWRAAHQSAAARGHVEMIRWLLAAHPLLDDPFVTVGALPTDDPVLKAARQGHDEIVRLYVQARRLPVSQRLLLAAASGGNAALVRWLLQRTPSTELRSVVNGSTHHAITSGSVELVRFLVEEHRLWAANAIPNAAELNNVPMLEYLLDVARQRQSAEESMIAVDLVQLVVVHGACDAVDWLVVNNPRLGPLYQVTTSRLDLLRRLPLLYDEATKNLNIELQCLEKSSADACRRRRPRLNTDVPYHRLLETLRRVVLAQPPSTLAQYRWLPVWAVQTRSYGILEMLMETQHPSVFSATTLRALVRFSRQSPWIRRLLEARPQLTSTRAMQWAVRYRRHDLIWWLLERCSTLPRRSDRASWHQVFVRTAIWTVAKHGHTQILQDLLARGHVDVRVAAHRQILFQTMPIAALRGHHVVLRWLVTALHVVNVEIPRHLRQAWADAAAKRGQIACLQWIHTTWGPCCSRRGLHAALGNGHIAVMDEIIANSPWLVECDLGLVARTRALRRRYLEALVRSSGD